MLAADGPPARTFSLRSWVGSHAREVWRSIVAATLLSTIAAGLSFYIITQVSGLLGRNERSANLWLVAAALPVLIALNMLARRILSRIAHDITYRVREDVIRRIVHASLRRVEDLGAPRIYAAATADVQKVAAAFGSFPLILFNALVLVVGAAVIAASSPAIFLVVAACAVLGAGSSALIQHRAIKTLQEERRIHDELFGIYEAVIYGKKELALSQRRRERFMERELPATLELARRLGERSDVYWEFLAIWNAVMLLALLLALVAIFPHGTGAEQASLTKTALVIFYLQAPLGVVIDMVQRATYARIAFGNLRALDLDWQAEPVPRGGARQIGSIGLARVTFAYPSQHDDRRFTVGPIDLTLRAGEVTIVTGANGSGKTSLCRLLCGLYEADGGAVLFDRQPVNAAELRGEAIALFSDYHPFTSVPADPATVTNGRERVDEWLERFRLAHKIRLDGTRWSRAALSTGQARRLALISVLLEDKSLYLFDEPTADQDVEMRELFHGWVVAELRRRGKIIVLVSHDERYFHTADHVYTMVDGLLERSAATHDAQARLGIAS